MISSSKIRFLACLLALAGGCSGSKARHPAPDGTSPDVLITLGKETSFITAPLRKDGYVDYVAALNELGSNNLAPTNNVAVYFRRAVGPVAIPPPLRDKYFRLLGVAPLPEKGAYFIPFDPYVLQQFNRTAGSAFNEKEIALAQATLGSDKGPVWTKKEIPALAAWLADNEKPLRLVTDAARCTRRFDPVVIENGKSLATGYIAMAPQYQIVARALVCRASLRLGEGQIDEAWMDLIAVHRLARLVAQGPTLMDGAVAFAMDALALTGDQAFLQSPKLTTSKLKQIQADLEALPPFPLMAEHLTTGERFGLLDAMGCFARDGFSSLGGPPHSTSSVPTADDQAVSAQIDWDLITTMMNEWYDRSAEALRIPKRSERILAIEAISLRTHTAGAQNDLAMALSKLKFAGEAGSRSVGEILVAMLTPNNSVIVNIEDRGTMRFAIVKLGFALARYHADHDSYPVRLVDLKPNYIADVPNDLFSDEELHYKLEGAGYLLYSVGVNGVDDGGKGANEGERCDDLSLSVQTREFRPK